MVQTYKRENSQESFLYQSMYLHVFWDDINDKG